MGLRDFSRSLLLCVHGFVCPLGGLSMCYLCARSVFMHAFGQASQGSSCCIKREQLDLVVCRPRMRMLRFLICSSKLLKDWYAFFEYWKRYTVGPIRTGCHSLAPTLILSSSRACSSSIPSSPRH